MYVQSSKELWDDIQERFAESNAPLIYQIKKEISGTSQENLTVSEYYGKRKKSWDELEALERIPNCTYGVMKNCTCLILKKMLKREAITKLMQFFMGLTKTYDNVRNTILAMDPLPSVNRAFHMTL